VHELGLCEAVVDAIERRAGERPVARVRVRVRVGLLHHVHPDAFSQSFAIAATGTIAEDAAAELVLLPITGRCHSCATEFTTDEVVVVCPRCASMEVEVLSGDELVLESIEYRA
jgi:hydrogenase nickel incorporation protein HypA/HybF